jgi:hypothetical protein
MLFSKVGTDEASSGSAPLLYDHASGLCHAAGQLTRRVTHK